MQNIKSCMKEIAAVANRTNLLALNASIEAARAGEQVTGCIDKADELGTAKSTLFGAMDDMLCQIEPMIKEIEASM